MFKAPKARSLSDVIGAADMVGKIAAGEIDEKTTDDGENAAAVAFGHALCTRELNGRRPSAGKGLRRRRPSNADTK